MKSVFNLRSLLTLMVLTLTIVWDKHFGSSSLGLLASALALPNVVSTFPDLTITKGKQKPFYPGKIKDAMEAQKASEIMVSDKDVCNEVISLIRQDVEAGVKYNVILGQYYSQYDGWNRETQVAHLNLLYKLRDLETPTADTMKNYTMTQNHILALYVEWPELLTFKKSVSDSRASIRYSRAKTDYKEHIAELNAKELNATAQALVDSGEMTPEKVQELLQAKTIKTAEDLTEAVEGMGLTLTVPTTDNKPKIKYVSSLKAFVIAFTGELSTLEELKVFCNVAGKLGVNPEKFDEWTAPARKRLLAEAKAIASKKNGEGNAA